MAAPSYASLRAAALSLDAERATLERQVAALVAELGDVATGALVSPDGFPRDDIDVGAVVSARGVIARLRNDAKAKAAEAEATMLRAFAALSAEGDAGGGAGVAAAPQASGGQGGGAAPERA